MLIKAPFHLPAGFLGAYGYRGNRRFIALYWEPCGDEACCDDGVSSSCGMANNWLYFDFVHRPEVSQWLTENHLNLGNSDEPAEHWLIVDALTNELYAAPVGEASQAVRRQQLPEES
jgi:hypothetical protein